MTKEELLETKEVQELLEETKDRIYQQVDEAKEELKTFKEESEKKVKELETKLAEADELKEKAEKELAEKKLSEFKEAKISEKEVSDKVKELLRKRVSGATEKEVEESIEAEMKYIEEIAPIFSKEGPKVHGIPSKEDQPREKTDEEILREGHERNWDLIKAGQKH